MTKQLELTIDLEIRRVTCPGVWLCQDGSVSLIVHALNSTYQTHLVPPVFPMVFKTKFQFRKKFPLSCAVRNLGCMLKDEDFYCELIQWTNHCMMDGGLILAQYLGALTDILFVPEVCSNEGIDLLMRRTKDYPGILAPKIEIGTRVRLEELSCSGLSILSSPAKACKCSTKAESHSHKPVCHTSQYHRLKSSPKKTCYGRSRSCCRATRQFTFNFISENSHKSCCGRDPVFSMDIYLRNPWEMPPRICKSICFTNENEDSSDCRNCCNSNDAFSAETDAQGSWRRTGEKSFANFSRVLDEDIASSRCRTPPQRHFTASYVQDYNMPTTDERYYARSLLESRYIDKEHVPYRKTPDYKKPKIYDVNPCTCYICRRYHEIFMPDYI